MTIPTQIFTVPLVLWQAAVPDPSKSDKPPNPKTQYTKPPKTQAQNTPSTPSGGTDSFFPDQSSNKPEPFEQMLEELGKSIDTRPPQLKDTIKELSLYDQRDGTWLYLGDKGDSYSDSVCILKDNRILKLAPFPNDLRIYTYNHQNNWTEVGTRTNDNNKPHTDPQISDGIKAILESRKNRNWISPNLRERLNKLDAKQHSDGTWLYYEKGYQNAHGDSMYITSKGEILMLGANANDTSIWAYNDNGWTQLGSRGTGPNDSVTFTPNNNNNYNTNEIIQGIQAILQSRKDRNWKSGQDRAAK